MSGLSSSLASPSPLKRPTLVFVTLVGFGLRGRSDWMEILFRIRSSPALGSLGVGACVPVVCAHLRVASFCARVRENNLVFFSCGWRGNLSSRQQPRQTRPEERYVEQKYRKPHVLPARVCVCVSVSVCLVGMWSSPRVPVYRHVLSVQHMLPYQKLFETCARRERVVWLIACFEALVLPSPSG